MSIEVKISKKRVPYQKALTALEKRVESLKKGSKKELLWILEHPITYTAGIRFQENEILDKKIKVIRTNRGGKVTLHNPGQKIIYLVVDLKKRKKDVRLFITTIEKSIIELLKIYNIKAKSDRKNIGIWVNRNKKREKVAAIGIKVKRWIAYHGFSLNISNDLSNYKKIIPCGIKDKGITSLKKINNKNYDRISEKIIKNLYSNLKI